MDDFALTPAERALFGALRARGVKFLIVGMGAAVLEGAPVATQDIDLWFESLDSDQIKLAAKDAGGFWISGFGMQPPAFGGDGLSRIDVVLAAHGLNRFADEYDAGVERDVRVSWSGFCPSSGSSPASERPRDPRMPRACPPWKRRCGHAADDSRSGCAPLPPRITIGDMVTESETN